VLAFSACTSQKASLATPEADHARYLADLEFIAAGPRTNTDPLHAGVQKLCADRLTELGFQVEQMDFGDGVNVIGMLPGTDKPEEIVIVSAHYDTIANSNGADDDASGVAGVLETARLLAKGQYTRTLVVACWDKEEPSLLGSYLYAARAKDQNTKIKVAYVYDEIGYSNDEPNSQKFPDGFELVYPAAAKVLRKNQYRANFVLLIFDQGAQPWAKAISDSAGTTGLITMELGVDLDKSVREALKGSDHASFWDKGYSAIEITDSADYRYPYQHTSWDTVEKLDPDFTIRIISAVTASVRKALGAPE
jgi:Zn-dependent M28 family amino/carboxypeptidase